MKKYYFLIYSLLLCAAIASCKKDNVVKRAPLISNDVSGSWKLNAAKDEYIFGTKSVITTGHYLPADTIDHISFKADGTGSLVTKGVIVGQFRYDATDSVIHFTEVKDPITKEYLGTGAFVRRIDQLTDTGLELTTQWFPSYGVYFYGNDRYDQIQYHTFYKKD